MTSAEAARGRSRLNLANAFTALRVALVPVFALLLLRRLQVPAAAVFVFAAITDMADGWVARRLNQVTSLGASLDPTADKLLAGSAFVILAVDGRVPWWAVAVIGVREIAVSGLRVWLVRRGRALPAVKIAKAKTWTQYTAVVLLTLFARHQPVASLVLALALVLTVVSGVRYFTGFREASVPWDGRGSA